MQFEGEQSTSIGENTFNGNNCTYTFVYIYMCVCLCVCVNGVFLHKESGKER